MSGGDLSRRAFVTGGAALGGALLVRGWAGVDAGALLQLDQAACLRALLASLSEAQRAYVMLPGDHPSRQLDNTGPVLRRPQIGELLRPDQRALVRRLFATTLSSRGREPYRSLLALEAGGLDACTLIVYGEPGAPGFHAMINGPHLLMRTGAVSATGVVWNGPLAYGHQVGNGAYRLAGNAFAFQAERANALYGALTQAERARARVDRTPPELAVQLQGVGGHFDGIRVAALGDAQKALAGELLDALLGVFEEAAARAARDAIDHHGGVEALHVAFYEEHGYYPDMQRYAALDDAARGRRGDPYFQVFRVEGPGSVLYFRGYPHLHAYLNVARDPARQHVGEVLAETNELIEGERLRALVQHALRTHAGTELAYAGEEAHSRFCPGPVTTGLLWTVDPYDNQVVVVRVKPSELSAEVVRALKAQGYRGQGGDELRVATTDYFAQRLDLLGPSARVEGGGRALREVLVEHVRRHGITAG